MLLKINYECVGEHHNTKITAEGTRPEIIAAVAVLLEEILNRMDDYKKMSKELLIHLITLM